jgi:MFS transporter, putative metabolite:H+ symporter
MSRPATAAASPRDLIARLDRIDVWALSYVFIGIIGTGFVFTFFDIFDINVSFVQTCVQIKPGCTPATAFSALTVPVVLNLAGYVVGTLILSPLSDRIGRRNMLLITMLITGVGSLYTAFAPDMVNFDLARIITGIGIGADLAIVNTYIGEVAPRSGRGRYTAVIFTMSAVGAFLGVWLGLLLTTPATPWPQGLPFALAGPSFTGGWRWMYGIGALLALVAILLRVELPESPRWLVSRGRLADAEHVVRGMEQHAERRNPLSAPVPDAAAAPAPHATAGAVPDAGPGTQPGAEPGAQAGDPTAFRLPYRELFTTPVYLRRIAVLLTAWLTAYITVYGFSSGFTSVMAGLRYPVPEAGIIAAVGTLGFIAQGLVAAWLADKLERRYWLPIGAVVTIVGAVLVAQAGQHIYIAFVGSIIIFFGFNMWVAPTYALSAESFPTRVRATGFAVVDGVGHLGGGIGVLVIAHYVTHLSTLGALLLISCFLVVAAVVIQFAPRTRGRPLDQISP